ncbi:MAG TPA: zf-HC2 domain-containing protein [Acidimicrobiales bacterium]|nr:zf-HC2 domain-containing protein [Acidimicrobiales bacterium]
MSAAEHADFEALSAYVDGEAPEWADHVEGCPRCRATAADLRALSATVGAPVDVPSPAQRDAAIARAIRSAALDAGAGRRVEPAPASRHEVERARLARRRWSPGSWAMPAVAAVVVALLGLSGLILSANRSTDESTATFAGPALDTKAESAVPGAPGTPVGDLGDVPDAATLRARVQGVPSDAAAAAGRATSSANAGAASDAAAGQPPNSGTTGAAVSAAPSATSGATGVAPTGGAGGSATITPNAVGTRPCEERARAREQTLGPVTYFATARQGTVPAYVLGFASPSGGVTLLMLAQEGCAELLRSAGP